MVLSLKLLKKNSVMKPTFRGAASRLRGLFLIFLVLLAVFQISAKGGSENGPRVTSELMFPPPFYGETTMTIRRGNVELPTRPEQLHPAEFEFEVPRVLQNVLPNGLKVFVYEAQHVNAFYFTVMVDAGKIWDPPDKLGIAELTARSMRTGGAGALSPDEFDKQLDQLGASLSVDVQRDYVRFDLVCLPEKASKAMELVRLMLVAPRFEAKAIDREKRLMRERIVREEDDPAELARREFRKLVYGTTHPLARTPLPDEVIKRKRNEIIKFYRSRYFPQSARIGIAAASITGAVAWQREFSSWAGKNDTVLTASRGTVAADKSPAYRGVYLAEKDMKQVIIRIGHVGRLREPREQAVADVLNNVLGMGGLTSRLMQKVRTEHGFAYAVGGGVFEDNPAGIFVAVASTQKEKAAEALAVMKEVVDGIREKPPSEEELETAKRDAIFSFANRFVTPPDTLTQYLLADLYGYPPDYLTGYVNAVRRVQAAEVTEAARRFIDPDKLTVLILGSPEVRQLVEGKFGPILSWPPAERRAREQRRN